MAPRSNLPRSAAEESGEGHQRAIDAVGNAHQEEEEGECHYSNDVSVAITLVSGSDFGLGQEIMVAPIGHQSCVNGVQEELLQQQSKNS